MSLSRRYVVEVSLVTQDSSVTVASTRLSTTNVTGVGLLTGPVGATGPTGPTGLTGVTGVTGSTGPTGPVGATGPTPADATTSSKGKVQLAGDLGGVGTAAATPIIRNVARVFNIKDPPYNAAVDGVTDDTVAVQAAINAAAGLGAVFIPPGTCLINTQTSSHGLIIPSNTILMGAGRNISILKQGFASSGYGTNRFLTNSNTIAGNVQIIIKDLQFLVPVITGTTPTMTAFSQAIQFYGCSDVVIENCWFQNGTISAEPLPAYNDTSNVNITGLNNRWLVVDNRFDSCSEAMGFVQGTDLIFEHNHCTNSYDSTLSINSSGQRIKIGNNIFDKQGNTFNALAHIELTNDQGSDSHGILDIVINGNIFLNATASTKGVQVQRVTDISISGNEFRSLTGNGAITTDGSSGLTITGNTMDTCKYGVWIVNDISSGNGPINVVGNTITGSSSDGIHITGGSNTLDRVNISSNTLTANTGYGINATASVTSGSIFNNLTSNNTAGAYNITGTGWYALTNDGNTLNIQPASSQYIKLLTAGGGNAATFNAGEGSGIAAYKGSGATYPFSVYNSTGTTTLALRVDASSVLNIKQKILGLDASSTFDIQPGSSSYLRLFTGGANTAATINAGEGSAIAAYKATGTTYVATFYASTDTTTIAVRIDGSGNLLSAKKTFLGGTTSPTALTHLAAGTASANTAPLKLTSGTNLTTPEDGAIEYDGSHLYIDIGSTRYQLDQQAESATALVTKTANYTLTASDYFVLGDTTSGGFTLTLPTAASISGRQYTIKKIAAANTLTIATTSAQTIDGSTTVSITVNNTSLSMVSDGSNWRVI